MGSLIRRALIAPAVVATLALSSLLTPAASAAPQLPTLQDLQGLSSSSLPASPLDELGRPTPETAAQVRSFAYQPWVPQEARDAILTALAFYAGTGDGEGGVALPDNAPTFTQFLWPTVSGSCIGGELDAVGSAIAVPGPAEIPAPGARTGETAFVFTALGTSPAATKQGGMNVQWFNLNTFRHGVTTLGNHGINPDGPATLSGTANTGQGTVIAIVSGAVHTEDVSCSFIPTAAIIDAR